MFTFLFYCFNLIGRWRRGTWKGSLIVFMRDQQVSLWERVPRASRLMQNERAVPTKRLDWAPVPEGTQARGGPSWGEG